MKMLVWLVFAFSVLGSGSMASAYERNFRFDPVKVLFGSFNVQAEFLYRDNLTIGPDIFYANTEVIHTDVAAYAVGARANIYMTNTAFADGWYVAPTLYYTSVSLEKRAFTGELLSATASGVAVKGLFGYQWAWEQFNISLGAGLEHYFLPSEVKIMNAGSQEEELELDDFSGMNLGYELTVGWYF